MQLPPRPVRSTSTKTRFQLSRPTACQIDPCASNKTLPAIGDRMAAAVAIPGFFGESRDLFSASPIPKTKTSGARCRASSFARGGRRGCEISETACSFETLFGPHSSLSLWNRILAAIRPVRRAASSALRIGNRAAFENSHTSSLGDLVPDLLPPQLGHGGGKLHRTRAMRSACGTTVPGPLCVAASAPSRPFAPSRCAPP